MYSLYNLVCYYNIAYTTVYINNQLCRVMKLKNIDTNIMCLDLLYLLYTPKTY
ncbi:hypothetical protein Cassandra_0158 [Pseudomonas phage Cassandra]|nr:hypothetical protein Cassandra_0158 [Pseudomonas phage Cassandra]